MSSIWPFNPEMINSCGKTSVSRRLGFSDFEPFEELEFGTIISRLVGHKNLQRNKGFALEISAKPNSCESSVAKFVNNDILPGIR
jgi:hypothetical protein